MNVVEQWRGQTALMWGAAQKQPEMIKLLLDHGAEPDVSSTLNNWERQVTAEPRMKVLPLGGYTALIYAAREGCALCIQHLVDAGADVNKTDPEAVSPNLQLQLWYPYRDLATDRGVDHLLTIGATPLFRAARGADIDAMRLLLEYGALVNLPNEDDITPLMVAAGYKQNPEGTRGRTRRLMQRWNYCWKQEE